MKKIMVVEDDPGILDAITMMLEMEGYKIEQYTDGKKAMEMKKGFPDLILLDIWLSGMDGRDICRNLKNDTRLKNIPVILISAGKDLHKDADECRAEGYIHKPFEMDILINTVKRHLKQ